jgi:propionate catabolism regulator PrpR
MPKILVTSPYPQFTKLVKQVSREQKLEVKIIEAVLDDAARLVHEAVTREEYEVVVSRGGTAEAIKKVVDVPVVTAEFNDFDLLQALWRARKMGNRIAYLGSAYREVFEFDELVEILGMEIKQYSYRNFREMEQQIARAREEGIEVLVGGGAWGQQLSDSMGMKGVIIFSSHRTVSQALERAVEVINIRRRDREYSRRLGTMIQAVSEGVVCIDENDKVLLVNHNAEDLLGFKGAQEVGKDIAEIGSTFLPLLNMPQGNGQRCTIRGTDLVVSRVAVAEGKERFGELFTMQKLSQLQQLEQKIRKELHLKGLVARFTFDDIVTGDRNLVDLIAKAKSFAQVDSTVLIRGESGCGKELFAQGIHRESPRANSPFVAINCAALPNELLESELFGYEEGAFTGARKGGKPGMFELAHNGTIFLDEIGSLSPSLQARLLRVLQEREVMRIGGDSVIPVNVRCIAATNENLQQAVRDERFRQDLYFRLNVLNLNIPPLRSRSGDIRLLAEHFLKQFNARFHKGVAGLPENVLAWMAEYSWPGNVRELQNFMERLVILAKDGKLDNFWTQQLLSEADEGIINGPADMGMNVTVRLGTLEEMEQQLIAMVEKRVQGNQSEIARYLGISRTTLWKKLNRGNEG